MTSLSLSRSAFVERATADDEPVVIHTTASLDTDCSAVEAYTALNEQGSHGFLLESGEKIASSDPNGAFSPSTGADDRHARFSFVGTEPGAVVTVTGSDVTVELLEERYAGLLDPDPPGADVLERLEGVLPDVSVSGLPDRPRQRLDGGLVGVLAYEAVYDMFLSELDYDRPECAHPDAQFVLCDTTVAFDHLTDEVELVFTPLLHPEDDAAAVYDELQERATEIGSTLASSPSLPDGSCDLSQLDAGEQSIYESAVDTAKQHVLDGDIYQGVISRTRELTGDIDPLTLYTTLRSINPSPYMYLLDHGDSTIVGASPETLVSVHDSTVSIYPLAGTCKRGDSPVEDRKLAGEMLADDKERAEHTMLVDLARNDVRRVSQSGSVAVEEFMNVFKYSHVQHIESTVTGTMQPELTAFDATRAAFPAGTLTGAPKIRAMEIIDELEPEPRGVYAGGLGYFSWNGDAELAIVIRTAQLTHQPDGTDRVTIQAGAGIVADSDPAAEYAETEQKMDAVRTAIETIDRPEP